LERQDQSLRRTCHLLGKQNIEIPVPPTLPGDPNTLFGTNQSDIQVRTRLFLVRELFDGRKFAGSRVVATRLQFPVAA